MQQAWTIANGLQCVQETHCRKPKRERQRELEQQLVVQRVVVKTLEYDDGILIWSHFGFVFGLTTRGRTPPISGSAIEQAWVQESSRMLMQYVGRVKSSWFLS